MSTEHGTRLVSLVDNGVHKNLRTACSMFLSIDYDDPSRRGMYNFLMMMIQVPLLTETTFDAIPSNTLVRYVGMVQDMFNPEYFVSEFRGADGKWETTRYSDDINVPIDNLGEKRFDERHPVLVIPVPGGTEWLSKKYNDMALESIQGFQPALGKTSGFKRQIDDEEMCPAEDIALTGSGDYHVGAGKASNAGKKTSSDGIPKDSNKNMWKDKKEIPRGSCVLHMYEATNGIKLNDVVEVLGVISRVPDLVTHTMNDEDDQEALASRIPTSMAPRIHAISVKKLTSLLPDNMPSVKTKEEIQLARSQTVDLLSTVLGGDVLAAEYLLMQLISRVHMRTEDSNASALGTLALNLTGMPDKSTEFVHALEAVLSGLMPSVLSLPLDIELLNKKPWYPSKLQNQSFLTDAILQLPGGSLIILDETAMTAGQLTEIGLKNLGAIQTMMQHQKLPYDFQFYQLDQPTDQAILVLSTGRTMLKGAGEVHMPLCPVSSAIPYSVSSITDTMNAGNPDTARSYLSSVRNFGFTIPQNLEKDIEHDMTEARKKDAANMNAGTFHTWMNIARLFCLSHGETEMTLTRWRQVMDMEAQRLARCTPATFSKPAA